MQLGGQGLDKPCPQVGVRAGVLGSWMGCIMTGCQPRGLLFSHRPPQPQGRSSE